MRWVSSPKPSFSLEKSHFALNHITGVFIEEGENVHWHWTTLPDGTSYVSGYEIVPAILESTTSIIDSEK